MNPAKNKPNQEVSSFAETATNINRNTYYFHQAYQYQQQSRELKKKLTRRVHARTA